MAPEQLEGKEADARTDIFAFGATVYEMVTGKKAFEGKSQVSLIGAILEREPVLMSTLMPTTPPSLDRTVKRCLAKDPDLRWQSAADLAHELEWIAESVAHPETAAAAPAAAPAKARTPAMFRKIATALLVVTALGGLAAGYLYRSPASPAVSRFFVSPPEKGVFVSGGRVGASGIISPDGRRLAFTARDGAGKVLLWVRPIDSLTAQPLAGTDEASFPFWSPDSRSLAYFAQDKLLKIDANGGPPQTVCAAPTGRGGAWSRDGAIVFGSGGGTLSRVSSAGGQPVVITRLAAGQVDHRFPSFLPDGRHLLFYVNGSSTEITGIYLASLDSGESTRLLASSSGGIYAPPGYLLFTRQGTLLAQPFNAKTVELTGDPFPIAERVESSVFQGVLAFSASENGVLAYGIGLGRVANLQMVWLDRQGKPIETIGPSGNYRGLDLAPDGRRVAAHRHDGQGGDVWVSESSRGTTSRLTFDASQDNSSPIWSPDGTRIAFGSLRTGKWGLYQKPSDGTGNDELLVQSDSPVAPMSWSPDGRSIVYSVTQLSSDVWLLPLSADRKAVPLLNTPFAESRARSLPMGNGSRTSPTRRAGSRCT